MRGITRKKGKSWRAKLIVTRVLINVSQVSSLVSLVFSLHSSGFFRVSSFSSSLPKIAVKAWINVSMLVSEWKEDRKKRQRRKSLEKHQDLDIESTDQFISFSLPLYGLHTTQTLDYALLPVKLFADLFLAKDYIFHEFVKISLEDEKRREKTRRWRWNDE